MRTLDADVCIVGAGTVGLVVGHLLARGGRRVTFVEAGSAHARELIERVRQEDGDPHLGRTDGRAFGVGGTSARWGGQLWARARTELAERPHLALPAWPVDYDDLHHGYTAVAGVLPLTQEQRRYLTADEEPHQTALGPVRYATSLPWRARNFGHLFVHSRPPSRRPVILTDHQVRALDVAGERCAAVWAVDGGGETTRIRAAEVVLAAGTIGNVELLASATDSVHLGRGFVDHLTGTVAGLEIVERKRLAQLPPASFVGGARFNRRILPRAGFAEVRGLPFGFAHVEIDRPAEMLALRSYLRGRQADHGAHAHRAEVAAIARSLPAMARSAVWPHTHGQEYVGARWRLRLDVDVEQLPDPANRLVSGPAGTRLHWRKTPSDAAAFAAYTRELLEHCDWAAAGLRPVPLPAPAIRDAFHMMGGTRMGSGPGDGVVDRRGLVFGLANVHVAGASVFPTGGMANPTFTACALGALVALDLAGAAQWS